MCVLLDLRKMYNLYVFFWVIPQRLNFIRRRFGTLCSIFIGWLVIHHLPAYEDGTECFETSAYKIQTSGNYHKRKHTTYRARRKFEIKNIQLHLKYFFTSCVLWVDPSNIRNGITSPFSNAGTLLFAVFQVKMRRRPFDGVLHNATRTPSSGQATTSSAVFHKATVKRVFPAVKILLPPGCSFRHLFLEHISNFSHSLSLSRFLTDTITCN